MKCFFRKYFYAEVGDNPTEGNLCERDQFFILKNPLILSINVDIKGNKGG